MSTAPNVPSDVAIALAELISDKQAFSDQAAWDLRRLLSHELAGHNAPRLRAGHLGLLVDMVANLNDPEGYVTEKRYLRELARRNGEDWPTPDELRTVYGGWAAAHRAAMTFWYHPASARKGTSRGKQRWETEEYTGEEIVLAIIRCRNDIGGIWPTEQEFEDYGFSRRYLARVNPRIPTTGKVRQAYGSYANALATAQRRVRR